MTPAVLQSIFFYTTLTKALKIFYKESVKRTFGAVYIVVLWGDYRFHRQAKIGSVAWCVFVFSSFLYPANGQSYYTWE